MDKRKQIIEVLPYDPNWIKLFEQEALLLKSIFGNNFAACHHVGSTSIPGLASKPTIDIILEVKDIHLVDDLNSQMANLGYEAWGEYGIAGRRFFLKGEEKRTHHVHTFEVNHPEVNKHIYFREYLKAHPHEAQQYADLKIKLANEFKFNRRAYIQNKQDYIDELNKKASDWFKNGEDSS